MEMEPEMKLITTFEESYSQYPFAELVRFSIGFGKKIAQWRAQHGTSALSMGEIYAVRVEGMAASQPHRAAA